MSKTRPGWPGPFYPWPLEQRDLGHRCHVPDLGPGTLDGWDTIQGVGHFRVILDSDPDKGTWIKAEEVTIHR